MKLLIFSPYHNPHIGGLESYVDQFDKYLSQKGIDITVFTPRIPEDSAEFEIFHGRVKVFRFPAFEIIHNYPFPKIWNIAFWKLCLKLYSEKFDAIISHTRFFSTSLLAFIFAKFGKKTWIHVEHGSCFVQSSSKIISFCSKMYDLTLGKLVLRSADRIIAVSESVRKFTCTLAPHSQCTVIYRGFNVPDQEPNWLLKNKYPNDIIILFIGRLISGKGVSDMLKAYSGINICNSKCLIIGDGPERKPLESLAQKLGIQENVVFLGYKSYDKTLSVLRIADIVINPSYSEGLPTTLAEAASYQKAIIATDVGGTAEIISDNYSGLLTPPHDISALREKITFMIKNPDRAREMGKNAKISMQEKFKWELAVEKFLNLIAEIKKHNA